MGEEWTDWIEHDGRGTPPDVIGNFVHMIGTEAWVMGMVRKPYAPFDWSNFCKPIPGKSSVYDKIIRYRIRKPRALLDLIDLVENLPETEDA